MFQTSCRYYRCTSTNHSTCSRCFGLCSPALQHRQCHSCPAVKGRTEASPIAESLSWMGMVLAVCERLHAIHRHQACAYMVSLCSHAAHARHSYSADTRRTEAAPIAESLSWMGMVLAVRARFCVIHGQHACACMVRLCSHAAHARHSYSADTRRTEASPIAESLSWAWCWQCVKGRVSFTGIKLVRVW